MSLNESFFKQNFLNRAYNHTVRSTACSSSNQSPWRLCVRIHYQKRVNDEEVIEEEEDIYLTTITAIHQQ